MNAIVDRKTNLFAVVIEQFSYRTIMASVNIHLFIYFVFLILIENVYGWRTFWKGRKFDGNLVIKSDKYQLEQLPSDQWFDQKLDHFNSSNEGVWKQVSHCHFLTT